METLHASALFPWPESLCPCLSFYALSRGSQGCLCDRAIWKFPQVAELQVPAHACPTGWGLWVKAWQIYFLLQSSPDNSAIKNHCPKASALLPKGSTLLLVEHEEKGLDGDIASLPVTVSWPSPGKTVSDAPLPRGNYGGFSSAAPGSGLRRMSHNKHPPPHPGVSLREAGRSGSAPRSRREGRSRSWRRC